jgi:hypothetical protein
MAKTISSSLSSFKYKIDGIKEDLDFLRGNYKILSSLYKDAKSLFLLQKHGLDSNSELFEFYFSDPTVPSWTTKDIALFVAIICILDPEGTGEWVSNYRSGSCSDYAHPELVDEFMQIYGRYFEQFGFKPKSDNDGGDDDESSPKTPSPDLLSV